MGNYKKRNCKGCFALKENNQIRCVLGHKTYKFINPLGRVRIKPMEYCEKPTSDNELAIELINKKMKLYDY